jgi:hypothetical protein
MMTIYSGCLIYLPSGSSLSDEMNTAGLRLNGNWNFGLQSLLAELDAQDNVMLKNTHLDNISGSAKLEWDWVVSNILTGQIGEDYARYLARFANTELFSKDIISDADYYAVGIRELRPHWRMNANVRGETATHSATGREGDDY